MKKFVSITVLSLSSILLTSACTNETSTQSPSSQTPSSQTPSSGPTAAQCSEKAGKFADLLGEYAEAVEYVTTQAGVDAAIATGREAVNTGRLLLNTCGKFAPAQAAQAASTLDELEDSLDTLESLNL